MAAQACATRLSHQAHGLTTMSTAPAVITACRCDNPSPRGRPTGSWYAVGCGVRGVRWLTAFFSPAGGGARGNPAAVGRKTLCLPVIAALFAERRDPAVCNFCN